SASTESLKDDSKERKNLLAIRFSKLLEAGAYNQTMELYSSLNLDQTPPEIAKYGILAMLFSGQKALACVEFHSVTPPAQDSDGFWKFISDFCADDKISPDTDKSVYDPEAYSKLSLFEKAKLAARVKTIVIGEHVKKDFRDVSPRDLQIL